MITQKQQVKDAGKTRRLVKRIEAGRKDTLKLTKYTIYGILNSAERQFMLGVEYNFDK